MTPRSISLVLATHVAILFVACGSSDESQIDDTRTPASKTTPSASPKATDTPSVPTATPTPALKHPDMALELKQGYFWDFRWEWTSQSCAQGRSCRNSEETGVFTVRLGEPRVVGGAEMFPITISGKHLADGGKVDLAPGWKFIGTDGPLLLGSTGSSNVTIFDASDGEWTGGGFFLRFSSNETHVASAGSISSSHPFAAWNGVRTGPAITVVRSDSQSMCNIVEGRRICPNDSSFSLSEIQFYRDEVGPLGYSYRYSASFSGGGFFSSSGSEERVALVASSLRGDVPTPDPTPTPPSTPTPEPTQPPDLTQIFGSQDGVLILNADDNQIPDFKAGVNLVAGVVDVTFVNPNVGGGDWSYGITFRHSSEETFHAVYVTSGGQWQHFARGGSPESQITPGLGTVQLNLGVGEENRLTVLFGLTEGSLWLNGDLVAELDLTLIAAQVAGDVRVIAGVVSTDVYNDAESKFYDLTIYTP